MCRLHKTFLLALVGLLQAEEFMISYAMQVQNGIATRASFGFSRALKEHVSKKSFSCEIPIKEPKLSAKQKPFLLDILLQTYQDQVVDCLYKGEVQVQSSGFNTHFQNQNNATLRIVAPANVHLEGALLMLEVYLRR
ncbi:hypothetical protein [Helicobacter suis]|uniref:hypothetical protein n=1 Tax=Helicobacter suis TaxID=104628 RepID=UPI0013D6146A|nr:hypothetical protein [Helicobacter suis]